MLKKSTNKGPGISMLPPAAANGFADVVKGEDEPEKAGVNAIRQVLVGKILFETPQDAERMLRQSKIRCGRAFKDAHGLFVDHQANAVFEKFDQAFRRVVFGRESQVEICSIESDLQSDFGGGACWRARFHAYSA